MAPPTGSRISRPLRSTRRKPVSYREDSDSDQDLAWDWKPQTPDFEENPKYPLQELSLRPKSSRKRTYDSFSSISSSTTGCLAVVQESPAKKRKDDVRIPWANLPYHILFEIFLYLSPAVKGHPETSGSAKQLWGICRLCRNFFEPAISALYFSPPLHPSSKLRGLLNLLTLDQDSLFINYRNKVVQLDIHDWSHINRIYSLLQLTPRLKHLRLIGVLPQSFPSSPQKKNPTHLLFCEMPSTDALRSLSLRSFEWSGSISLQSIKDVHSHPAFARIRSLHFSGLTTPKSDKPGELQALLDTKSLTALELRNALTLLPDLRRLEFTQCDFPGIVLLTLPMDLESLSITDCNFINSERVLEFLKKHGLNLHELVLVRNGGVGTSYTAALRDLCPSLRVFVLELSNKGPFPFSGPDTSFVYGEHFADPPTWPSSLQHLELRRVCKCDDQSATAFFNSLIEAAPYLPDLRTLIVTATIKVSWRNRAEIRRHWAKKLEDIFLRKSPLPVESDVVPSDNDRTAPARRSTRIAAQDESSSSLSARPQENLEASMEAVQIDFVHGLCDVVQINIDNLRPTEKPFPSTNLSDADSDDSDWNGVDLDFDDGYAW